MWLGRLSSDFSFIGLKIVILSKYEPNRFEDSQSMRDLQSVDS